MSLNIEKSCGNYITGFSNYSTGRISNMKKMGFFFSNLSKSEEELYEISKWYQYCRINFAFSTVKCTLSTV